MEKRIQIWEFKKKNIFLSFKNSLEFLETLLLMFTFPKKTLKKLIEL